MELRVFWRANTLEFHTKILQAWDSTNPDVLLPATVDGEPLTADGGLEAVVGFSFQPADFDVYGGCAAETMELLMSYAKRVATRQGSSAKSVLNTVYTKTSYTIWSASHHYAEA